MNYLCILLSILHFIVGIGALAGGSACLVNPISPLGASSEMLAGSPFSTFLIPGLFLFFLFGVGNFAAGILSLKRITWYGYLGLILGGGMVIWIVVQVIIIKSIVFLHVLFFIIGLIQASIGLFFSIKEHLFPFSILGAHNNPSKSK